MSQSTNTREKCDWLNDCGDDRERIRSGTVEPCDAHKRMIAAREDAAHAARAARAAIRSLATAGYRYDAAKEQWARPVAENPKNGETFTLRATDLDFTPDAQHSISDMANIGKALLESISSMCPGYAWNESPVEIVSDLLNSRADAMSDYDRGLVKWAVERWNAEVHDRPLSNVHRRALDDTWRQVIRHCGANDVALLGLTHSELLAAQPRPTAQDGAQ